MVEGKLITIYAKNLHGFLEKIKKEQRLCKHLFPNCIFASVSSRFLYSSFLNLFSWVSNQRNLNFF